MGGLFVSGSPCEQGGAQLEVIVSPAKRAPQSSDRYTTEVVRSSATGFALKFNHLDESRNGEELFEGLLIVAPQEDIVDLAGWMRLTSLLCNQYRRLCSKNHFDHLK